MANEYSISTIQQVLEQMKLTRRRLANKLNELEEEADDVRKQLREIDGLIEQQESSMFRILTGRHISAPPLPNTSMPSNAEIEAALENDRAKSNSSYQQSANYQQPPIQQPAPPSYARTHVVPLQQQVEVTSDRFTDRTIPQAVTMLLREETGPLHVNEIYVRLLEGGFEFTGNNPTISIAVSLNRNTRFRKVAPGTFDLVMREAGFAKA